MKSGRHWSAWPECIRIPHTVRDLSRGFVASTVASARRTDRVRLLSLNKRGLAFALNRFLNSHPAPMGDRPHRELSTIS